MYAQCRVQNVCEGDGFVMNRRNGIFFRDGFIL